MKVLLWDLDASLVTPYYNACHCCLWPLYYVTIVSEDFVFFIVVPCILISIKSTDQQMHSALRCRMRALLASYNAVPHNRYQPHPAETEQYTICSNTRSLFSWRWHNDARNMLRQKLIINTWLLHLVGFLSLSLSLFSLSKFIMAFKNCAANHCASL